MLKPFAIVAALIVFFAAIAAYFFLGFGKPQIPKKTSIKIKGQEFRVEIANTPYLRSKGLSGRELLPEDAGMLFVFEDSAVQTFWMKEMKFSLDIIWIRDNRIVGIERNVQPEPGKSVFSLTTYHSPAPVNRVLEINAGLSEKYGFEVGDMVEL